MVSGLIPGYQSGSIWANIFSHGTIPEQRLHQRYKKRSSWHKHQNWQFFSQPQYILQLPIPGHFEYDGIITGSSMTENFKTSEADEFFNAACQGCCAVFSYIKCSGNQVLQVVLLSHHNQQSNRSVSSVTPHCLHHSFATHLMEQGVEWNLQNMTDIS